MKKLALTVAAMLEARTPTTIERAGRWPLERERSDRREPWRRRWLKKPWVEGSRIMEPARTVRAAAATGGQTLWLSREQSELSDRLALLRVSVGACSLPLAWCVTGGLPAERFSPGAALFQWRHPSGGQYRRRLKGHRSVDGGDGNFATTPAFLDEGARWALEPMFSNFKTRDFRLEATPLEAHHGAGEAGVPTRRA